MSGRLPEGLRPRIDIWRRITWLQVSPPLKGTLCPQLRQDNFRVQMNDAEARNLAIRLDFLYT